MAIDLFITAAAFFFSHFITHAGRVMDMSHVYFPKYFGLYMACGVVFSLLFRLWHISWRFISLKDVEALSKYTIAVNLGMGGGLLLISHFYDHLPLYPLTAVITNVFVLEVFLCAPRFLYRYIHEHQKIELFHKSAILVGSTQTVDLFIRYNNHAEKPYRIAGILLTEEDRKNVVHKLHGHKVQGLLTDNTATEELLAAFDPEIDLIITDPKFLGARLNGLYKVAKLRKLNVLRVSDIRPLSSRHAVLRPVNIEDLLGRPPVKIEDELIQSFIENRTVMITGAGGSIGSEIVRQVVKLGAKKIILFESSEYFLYLIDGELRSQSLTTTWVPIVGDVTKTKDVMQAFTTHKPDIVFHAAALKHVPLSEANVRAAFETNFVGTANVADACHANDVKTMVLISTDKAVHPTNVMGLSKRTAEVYCQSLDQQADVKTRYISVRFGNVLGSTGSVIPLFQKQIAAGGPVTVTDERMERFFMTIREAVSLVLQAGAFGTRHPEYRGGIFVLDMGDPVRIMDMAEKMISLSGYTPYKEIDIRVTGIRPGEKLKEELAYDEEDFQTNISPGVHFVAPRKEAYIRTPLIDMMKAIQGRKAKDTALVAFAQKYVP